MVAPYRIGFMFYGKNAIIGADIKCAFNRDVVDDCYVLRGYKAEFDIENGIRRRIASDEKMAQIAWHQLIRAGYFAAAVT